MLNGTSCACNILFVPTQETPAKSRRFLSNSFTVYGLSFTVYGPSSIVYGFLGAAGVVIAGVGLVPKSTVGGASVPAAASK